MIKKLFFISIMLVGLLHAATLQTNKNVYAPNENVVATFSEMLGDNKDWIAIYPAGSTNAWDNVIQWDWTGGVINGTHTFNALPAGAYDVRVFYANTYNVEASKSFTVENNGNPVELTMSKAKYTPAEQPTVTFANLSGSDKDWIAIYPAGSTNEWNNVIQWDWAGAVNGTHTFNALPVGQYEVRVFFNNSYTLEASKSFSVEEGVDVILTTTKETYASDEGPIVVFKNMSGSDKDWLGIYPAGSSDEWDNMIQWDWAGAINGSHVFEPLPVGEYEVRAFFNNTLNSEASKSFTVANLPVSSTVYEDAENGLNPNWVHVSGNYTPIHYGNGGFESTGALILVPEWEQEADNSWTNLAEYRLALNSDASKKVLEIDVGGLGNYKLPNIDRKGYIPHYNISVRIHTLNGNRRIIWDSFFNHNGITEPFHSAGGAVINSPSPVEHVRGWYEPDVFKWEHFKVNIETVLKKLEPNNAVTSVDTLSTTGGFLDNIKLSSH